MRAQIGILRVRCACKTWCSRLSSGRVTSLQPARGRPQRALHSSRPRRRTWRLAASHRADAGPGA
eukprot:3771713-Prymnesium_polylepis.2